MITETKHCPEYHDYRDKMLPEYNDYRQNVALNTMTTERNSQTRRPQIQLLYFVYIERETDGQCSLHLLYIL